LKIVDTDTARALRHSTTERRKIKVNIVGLLGGNVNNFAKRHEANFPFIKISFSDSACILLLTKRET
jgi:hypothetical protein